MESHDALDISIKGFESDVSPLKIGEHIKTPAQLMPIFGSLRSVMYLKACNDESNWFRDEHIELLKDIYGLDFDAVQSNYKGFADNLLRKGLKDFIEKFTTTAKRILAVKDEPDIGILNPDKFNELMEELGIKKYNDEQIERFRSLVSGLVKQLRGLNGTGDTGFDYGDFVNMPLDEQESAIEGICSSLDETLIERFHNILFSFLSDFVKIFPEMTLSSNFILNNSKYDEVVGTIGGTHFTELSLFKEGETGAVFFSDPMGSGIDGCLKAVVESSLETPKEFDVYDIFGPIQVDSFSCGRISFNMQCILSVFSPKEIIYALNSVNQFTKGTNLDPIKIKEMKNKFLIHKLMLIFKNKIRACASEAKDIYAAIEKGVSGVEDVVVSHFKKGIGGFLPLEAAMLELALNNENGLDIFKKFETCVLKCIKESVEVADIAKNGESNRIFGFNVHSPRFNDVAIPHINEALQPIYEELHKSIMPGLHPGVPKLDVEGTVYVRKKLLPLYGAQQAKAVWIDTTTRKREGPSIGSSFTSKALNKTSAVKSSQVPIPKRKSNQVVQERQTNKQIEQAKKQRRIAVKKTDYRKRPVYRTPFAG